MIVKMLGITEDKVKKHLNLEKFKTLKFIKGKQVCKLILEIKRNTKLLIVFHIIKNIGVYFNEFTLETNKVKIFMETDSIENFLNLIKEIELGLLKKGVQ